LILGLTGKKETHSAEPVVHVRIREGGSSQLPPLRKEEQIEKEGGKVQREGTSQMTKERGKREKHPD